MNFDFFNKEKKIKNEILSLENNTAISFSTPNQYVWIDIWLKNSRYKMVSRQAQVVGKELLDGYKCQTYTRTSEVIYSEETIGEYADIDEVMNKVETYRKSSSSYFSKNHLEWTKARK